MKQKRMIRRGASRVLPILVAAGCAASASAPSGGVGDGSGGPEGDARAVAFVDVTVIPMDEARALEHRTVVTRGNRIAAIGPVDEIVVPADADVVDGAGRYLMPGLVDMHIHVVEGTGEEGDGAWQQMALLVANGITTARSLAGAPTGMDLRESIRAGRLAGPDLYLAGPSLNYRSVTTPDAARAAVREQSAAGYDVLKTHGVTSEVYDAIVETAAEEGIRLVGHVTPDYGLDRALAAGQQIEHLDGYLAASIPEGADVTVPPGQVFFGPELEAMSEAAMPELARRTVEAGVWNTPTLALFELVADPEDVDYYRSLPEMRYVPDRALDAWSEQVAGMAAAPVPDGSRARYLELRRSMTRALRDAGAGLLAGSDSPQLFMAPGFALHRELEALQRAGLTPFQVLTAATAGPARWVGGDARFGTVSVGAEADLLLLDADPLADVANARRIAGVQVDGRWLSADDLADLLEAVSAAAKGGSRPAAEEAASGGSAGIAAELDAYLERLEVYGFSGAVVVARGDDVVLEAGYGLADDSSGEAVTPRSPFLIGSLSKQFTAAAVLRLAMDGALSTDDTVGRFFPDAPDAIADVTLHELLTHTAGLPYLPADFMAVRPRAEIMDEMLALPVDPAARGSYSYSSPGYTLLAGVIERASGTSYETYLRDALFRPAGMTDTGFIGDSAWAAYPRTHSYSDGVDEGALQEFPSTPKGVGAGSIVSTVRDLRRWERALDGGTVLSEEATRRLFARHVTVQGQVSHGYGWNIATTTRGTELIVHGGDIGGYNAELRRYVDEDLSIILLSNRRERGQGWRNVVMNNLSLIVAGQPHQGPPAVSRPAPGDADGLVGDYRLPGGGLFRVRAGRGVLEIGAEGPDAARLLSGAGEAADRVAAELGERSDSVITALVAGDAGPFAASLHPSLPAEGAVASLRGLLAEDADRWGAARSVEVVGTGVAAPVLARTAVRIAHPYGQRLLHIGWYDGRIASVDSRTELPLATRFARADGDTFVAWDPATGREVRVSFEREAGARAGGLTIGGSSAGRIPR